MLTSLFILALQSKTSAVVRKEGEPVQVLVGSLRSPRRPIPLDPAALGLFCLSDASLLSKKSLNNEALARMRRSLNLSVKFLKSETSVEFCRSKPSLNTLKRLIDEKYRVFLFIDEIPVTTMNLDTLTGKPVTIQGFDLGYVSAGKHFIYNNWDLTIHIGTGGEKMVSKVEFSPGKSSELTETVSFSYSIGWETSTPEIQTLSKVHKLSMMNGALVVITLFSLVGYILYNSLSGDKPSQLIDDDPLEEIGWKLVHCDVFRTPKTCSRLFSLVGTGLQLMLTLAVLFFFHTSVTTALLVFDLMALVGAFTSAKLFRTFGDKSWKSNIIQSTLAFSGPALAMYSVAQVFYSLSSSSANLSIGSLLKLVSLLIVVCFIFTTIGAVLGFKSHPYDLPAKVNQLPRQIPNQPWYLHPFSVSLIGGLLVFTCIFVEGRFILIHFWTSMTEAPELLPVAVSLLYMVIVSAAISVVFIYANLCFENYHWWWRSFYIPASGGVIFFLYSLYFMLSEYKPVDFSSVIIYTSISGICSFVLSLVCGASGFLSTFAFVKKIYDTLKME